jgi:hypothetical protein
VIVSVAPKPYLHPHRTPTSTPTHHSPYYDKGGNARPHPMNLKNVVDKDDGADSRKRQRTDGSPGRSTTTTQQQKPSLLDPTEVPHARTNHSESAGPPTIQAKPQPPALLEKQYKDQLPHLTCSMLCRALVKEGGLSVMESILEQGGKQTLANPVHRNIAFSFVGQPSWLKSKPLQLRQICNYIEACCKEANQSSERIGWVFLNSSVVFHFPAAMNATVSLHWSIWNEFVGPALIKM